MKDRLLKWMMYKFFYITINDDVIDQEFILRLSQKHLNTPRANWKNKYFLNKLSYCSDRYKAINGVYQYSELASRLLMRLDAEEEKSRRKIAELMIKFLRSVD